jgi:thiamine pyrophosphate-dependent acetolactate synthase large subunit-like protein
VHSAEAQAELVRPFVTFDAEPRDVEGLLEAVARAFRAARSAPTGPTYVTLDVELQERPLEEALPRPPRPAPATAVGPDEPAVEAAADRLVGARAPAILAGRTGLDPDTTPLLVDLAEALGAVCVDERNFVSFPTDHQLNLTGDTGCLADADVVLAVAPHDLRAALTRTPPPAGHTLVTISPDGAEPTSWSNFRRDQPTSDVAVTTDPAGALRAILTAVTVRRGAPDRSEIAARTAAVARRHRDLRGRQRRAVEERWEDRPVSAARLVGEVWQAVRDRPWLLTVRNTRSWPEGLWRFDGGGRYLGHSGGGGVGYGPGAMIGGGLAARDRGELAVAIIGDGDLLMGPTALWTAVHHRLPMLVVVNDNRSFGNDEAHQERIAGTRGRPVDNAWIGTRIADPDVDVAGLARSFGAWAAGPVADPEALGDTLREALEHADAGAVAVVHVLTGDR